MSHAVKYRCTHRAKIGTTAIIDILQDGFTGSVTEVKGASDVYELDIEKIDSRDPFKNPVQKGRLEFYLHVRDSFDQDILDEIFGADENQYQLRLTIDGTVIWTGAVLNDLLEYSEGPYPYSGTIVAKDLTRLSAFTYPLVSGRETIITTIADLLDDIGLGLDIYTYTSWTEDNILSTDDFLNQIYNDTFALREYARTGDESDQSLKHDELLDRILRNYGLILRQDEGAWRLYQLTAFTDPTSVKEYRYNSLGVQQSSSTVDMTVDVDRVARFILPSSMNMINPAVKEAQVRFDHRTKVSGIQLPESFDATQSFSQFFKSDGNQTILLSGRIRATLDDENDSADGKVIVEAESNWWDEENNEWSGTLVTNSIPMFTGHVGVGTVDFVGVFNFETTEIPAAADGQITLTFNQADGNLSGSTNTKYSFCSFELRNPVVTEGDTAAIDYRVTQSGNFSKVYDHGEVWFGDGPDSYSRSALSADSAGDTRTNDSWKRIGEASTVDVLNLLLREIMDTQRSATRNLDGDLWGQYSTKNLISYNSNHLFFMGGTLTGKENIWNGRFLQLNIQTA